MLNSYSNLMENGINTFGQNKKNKKQSGGRGEEDVKSENKKKDIFCMLTHVPNAFNKKICSFAITILPPYSSSALHFFSFFSYYYWLEDQKNVKAALAIKFCERNLRHFVCVTDHPIKCLRRITSHASFAFYDH